MKPDCVTVEEAIWNFARGGAELNDEARRHIEQCASCAEALAEAQAGLAALRCLKPHPQAPDCRDQVASRIGSAGPAIPRLRYAWVAAPVTAAALVAGLFLFNPGGVIKQTESRPVRQAAGQASQPITPAHVEGDREPKPGGVGTMGAPATDNLPRTAIAHTKAGGLSRDGGTVPPGHPGAGVTYGGGKELAGSPGTAPAGGTTKAGGQQGALPGGTTEQGTSGDVAVAPYTPRSPTTSEGTSPQPATEVNRHEKEQAAFAAQRKARLDKIAVLINILSQGERSLLLKSGASASPAGYPVRWIGWGDLPFAVVYPASRPVEATLAGQGYGEVLGAVALLEYRAQSPGVSFDIQPAGVYLVFLPTFRAGAYQMTPTTIRLLSIEVDDSGHVTYSERSSSPLIEHTAPKDGALPHVAVSYEGSNVVFDMAWEGESYRFAVEQRSILK